MILPEATERRCQPVTPSNGTRLPAATAATAQPVLAVDDLHVTFPAAAGDVQALRGASLQIRPGEIMGLVGESGSGKSVLGMAALGLLPRRAPVRTSGEVRLAGHDMLQASEEERRERRGSLITAVFQDPMGSLNPSMRIGTQVAEAAPGASAEEIQELLASTGIPEPAMKMRAYPHELSGGLRQRVMIAMALARRPGLIVADEPTTALDVTVQARVLDLLAHACSEQGAALLLITHDLGVAARICDRIAVAYAGRIVETGSARTILHHARHPYARGLLASRPKLDGSVPGGRLPTLPGAPPDPRRPLPGCAFAPRCPAAGPECSDPAPVPIAAEGEDVCECHHPGTVTTWPAGEPGVQGEGSLLSHLTSGSGAPAPVDGNFRPAALILEKVTRDFARPRRHLFAAAPAPLRAVNDISLTLGSGGSLAIVGESGSGKTTLLRMIVGLQAPSSGRVAVGPGPSPQLVFQDAGASLTPWMTIGDQISERLSSLGIGRDQRGERTAAALRAVGLPPEAARALPRQLSGGMRQRAAIARAIAVPPPLLACDEPVSALDVSLASQVLNLLCDLRRQLGIALLFVTHDLAAARAVADEVLVMQGGCVVEYGPADQLFASPQHPYTQELLAAVPDVSEAA